MKKKLFSLFTAFCMALSLCAVFNVVAYAADDNDRDSRDGAASYIIRADGVEQKGHNCTTLSALNSYLVENYGKNNTKKVECVIKDASGLSLCDLKMENDGVANVTITFENCEFSGDNYFHLSSYGYVSLIFKDCVFNSNIQFGSTGGYSKSVDITFESCDFKGTNTYLGDCLGDVIFTNCQNMQLINANNTWYYDSDAQAAGVNAKGEPSTLCVTGCTFIQNQSGMGTLLAYGNHFAQYIFEGNTWVESQKPVYVMAFASTGFPGRGTYNGTEKFDGSCLTTMIASYTNTVRHGKNETETALTVYVGEEPIRIEPVSITSYVGGTSLSGNAVPTLRFKVKLPESIILDMTEAGAPKISTLTMQLNHKTDDGWKTETEMLPMLIEDSSPLEDGYSFYYYFPTLESGLNNDTENPLKGDYLELEDISMAEGLAGRYKVELVNPDTWYITATTGEHTYSVEFNIPEIIQITTRYVSDESTIYDHPSSMLTKVVTTSDEVDTSTGKAVALIPKGATFYTNGIDSGQGILGAEGGDG